MTTRLPNAASYALWSSLQAEFERYREAVGYIPTNKLRIQEDLRRYLCVRCAGFLERLVFDTVHQYLEAKSAGPALNFAKSGFHRAPNLDADSFRKVFERFGASHRAAVDAFLTKSRIEAMNDLSDVRNTVAHGRVSGGQKVNPDRYRRLCEDVFQWLTTGFLEPIGSIEQPGYSGES